MTLRALFIALAALIAMGAAWSKRQALETLLSPSPPPPKAGPQVNVLPALVAAKPNESSTAGKSKPSLRDALDLERDGNLKDRMMDRVIDGQK